MTVFALLAPDARGVRAAEMLAAAVVLMIAVLTSGAPLRTRRAAIVVVALPVGGIAIGALVGSPPVTLTLSVTAFLAAATILVLVGGLARLVLDRGVLVAVFGALTVYLLVGLMFAYLIGALATGVDGGYFASGTDGTQADRVYFSFTALTTTGFGDFTARTRGGHALTVAEMLIGQLYLVTVIATLVGNLRPRPAGESSRLREAIGMPAPVHQPSDQPDG